MNPRISRLLTTAALAGSLLLAVAPAALAHDASGRTSGGSYGDWGRGDYGFGDYRGVEAASYINPDTGAATANPDVDPQSNCFRRDQRDNQALSPAGTATNNVHNDACFLDDRGNKVNGPASFQSRGVGFISACPDPDGNATNNNLDGGTNEFARLTDTNGDGRNDLCFQSAYQTGKGAGDFEFHARLNNTTMNGTQYVTWCADANQNGCRDEYVKDSISIEWGQTSSWGGWGR